MQRSFFTNLKRSSALGFYSASAKTPVLATFLPLKQNIAKLFFSTSQSRFSSVAKELQTVLNDEIKAEKNMEEEKLGGNTPPSIPGFQIEKQGAEFRLTKTYGAEKILVTVNVNHSVSGDDEDRDDDDEYNSGEEDMEHTVEPIVLPPFHVEITKGDLRLVFIMQMVTTQDGGYDYSVEEFMIAPATKGDRYVDAPDDVYSSSGEYIDQKLHNLLFIRYLEERGFTTNFCHDLVKFATHYEHQQYVGLLEKITKFIDQ